MARIEKIILDGYKKRDFICSFLSKMEKIKKDFWQNLIRISIIIHYPVKFVK